MELLGLHYAIWIVVTLYFVGMLLLGWWSKREAKGREGFLLGKRQFGVPMMIMHAFGAGTHPGDVAGVTSQTVRSGASGIWVSWMWMFGTPFYWLIAPVVRRMRYLTLADYFEERFSRPATVLYVIIATVGMTIATASVLLATTRTVQGMMGKATVEKRADTAEAADQTEEEVRAVWAARGVKSEAQAKAWFVSILLATTAVFVIYSYWGGIVAVIRTDFVQGMMIIVLSFIAIPLALYLPEIGGWAGTVDILRQQDKGYLSLFGAEGLSLKGLFSLEGFSIWAVILLGINAPFSMLAQPHLITVCGAGKSEWEGRMGFTYGNILKRICTMGWCFLALMWLAFLIQRGSSVQPDAAFGDSVRYLLHPVLQGIMLSCVLAAGMSSGSAIQVTVAGLISQNIYRTYIRPEASEDQCVRVTKWVGVVVIAAAFGFAYLMRASVVKTILDYFKLTGTVGISVGMGILWRRMNSKGMYASTIAAAGTFLVTRYLLGWGQVATTGLPLAAAILFGVIGSLVSKPPKAETIEEFFKKIYVPVGEEEKLDLTLDEAVPPEKRLSTAAGLFLVKPSTQSWVGFLLTAGICVALVAVMLALLM